MKIQLRHSFLLFLIMIPLISFSQDTLDLIANPSFEAEPKRGSHYDLININKPNIAKTWFDCGKKQFPKESRPDIFPLLSDNVAKIDPSDGYSYIGLVVRDNSTWEEISHELSGSLAKGSCYIFSIDLAKSSEYLNYSRIHKENSSKYSYDNTVILKIWGGLNYCEEFELLYKSPPVENQDWQSYEVIIQPTSDINHITVQAYYIDDSEPYNGNILIDNISPIIKYSCDK